MSAILIVTLFTVISIGIFFQHLVMNMISNRILNIELSIKNLDEKLGIKKQDVV